MATVSFDGVAVQVLTLVYAYVDGKVLTLERAATKTFLPGWLVGLGGKVEPGETVLEGAAREFTEESGLVAKGLELRGSYTFMNTVASNRAGVIYLFVADGVEGEFKAEVEDGTLRWLTVAELLANDKVMIDHKRWLGRIFENRDHFACVGSWEERFTAVEWADSRRYFEGRVRAT